MEDTIICLAHNQNTIKKDHFFKEENKVNSLLTYGLDPNINEILKKIKKKHIQVTYVTDDNLNFCIFDIE